MKIFVGDDFCLLPLCDKTKDWWLEFCSQNGLYTLYIRNWNEWTPKEKLEMIKNILTIEEAYREECKINWNKSKPSFSLLIFLTVITGSWISFIAMIGFIPILALSTIFASITLATYCTRSPSVTDYERRYRERCDICAELQDEFEKIQTQLKQESKTLKLIASPFADPATSSHAHQFFRQAHSTNNLNAYEVVTDAENRHLCSNSFTTAR